MIVTTTTHMAYEPDRPFAEDGDMISIKQNLEEYRIYDCCFIGQRKA